MNKNKTRDKLIKMYIDSLKEDIIPWRKTWISDLNINGVSNKEYRGINQLLLSFVSFKEQYGDNRWFTYAQIKEKNYKLKNGKNKGIPIEFWSVYDIKNKKKIDLQEYENIIKKHPELKSNFRIFCNTSYVFNASLIEGLPPHKSKLLNKCIRQNNLISTTINKLKIKYKEEGNMAFYNPLLDQIILPESSKFQDKYSYYATQLHELCHATGHKSRLNRNLINNNKQDYAREELIAEISSSFLMQRINIKPLVDDYNNHKSYIQNWLQLLEDKPNELFKAINEANVVCNYIESYFKEKNKNIER